MRTLFSVALALTLALSVLAASEGNQLASRNMQQIRNELEASDLAQAQTLVQQLARPGKFLGTLDQRAVDKPA